MQSIKRGLTNLLRFLAQAAEAFLAGALFVIIGIMFMILVVLIANPSCSINSTGQLNCAEQSYYKQ